MPNKTVPNAPCTWLEKIELRALRIEWRAHFTPIYRTSLAYGALACLLTISVIACGTIFNWVDTDSLTPDFLWMSAGWMGLVTPLLSLPHALGQLPPWPTLRQLRAVKGLKSAWTELYGQAGLASETGNSKS